MSTSQIIRPLELIDIPDIKAVIDSCGLFSSDLLDGMTAPYFNGEAEDDFWVTYDEKKPVAVAYCAPERMTDGTWNLLLIAVHSHCQGKGYGTSIVRYVENLLVARGGRLLLVETSSFPSFAKTRQFYKTLGYGEEAKIRDFYQPGEDKVVLRKVLGKVRI